MVPKLLHYIWITPPNGKQFSMHHMASINSAHFYNPDYKIYLHCDKEPQGEFYDRVKHLVNIEIVEVPQEIFGVPFLNNANKGTILRIMILIKYGGVYQDIDVYTMRSYDDLLLKDNCMGIELSEKLTLRQVLGLIKQGKYDVIKYKGRIIKGLCNGFLIAKKDSQFLKDWYEGFRNYDNTNWGFYSVKMPYALYNTGKYDFHIIPPYQSHYPSCSPDDLKLIFEKNLTIPGKYFLHTWEARSYDKYALPLTKEQVMTSNTTYCNAIKKFI